MRTQAGRMGAQSSETCAEARRGKARLTAADLPGLGFMIASRSWRPQAGGKRRALTRRGPERDTCVLTGGLGRGGFTALFGLA